MKNMYLMPLWFRSNRWHIFCKLGVARFTEKHLFWSLFLKRLQISWPETSIEREFSTGISLWILRNFRKTLFTERLWMNTCAPKLLRYNQRFIDWSSFFLFFLQFLLLLVIIAITRIYSVCFFFQKFIKKLMWMLSRNMPWH